MVQSAPNWAIVIGVVRARREGTIGRDWDTLVIAVESVQDVEGYYNLLSEAVGTELEVFVPSDTASAQPGTRVRCRVRREAPKRNFSERSGAEVLPDDRAEP